MGVTTTCAETRGAPTRAVTKWPAHIEYWDDTGFTADGEFTDDVLHHVGLQFYRETTQK